MENNIYKIQPKGGGNWVYDSYDVYTGFIVSASSIESARDLAFHEAGEYANDEMWKDEEMSSCIKIGKSYIEEETVIMSSFTNG